MASVSAVNFRQFLTTLLNSVSSVAQDVAYRDIRQLLMYQFYVFLVRDDPYIFRGNDICKAGVRQLYKRLAHSQDIDELLGTVCCAHRPEPAAYSSRHDDKMIIRLRHSYVSKNMIKKLI